MILVPYERYQKLTANQTTMGEENRTSYNVKRKKGIDGPDPDLNRHRRVLPG